MESDTKLNLSKSLSLVPIQWLPLFRLSVIVTLILVDVFFFLGLPYFYERLTTLCTLPNCQPLVLTAADVLLLEGVGLSISFYALLLIGVEIVNVLIVNLFCIYYLRLFMMHWLGYVASLAFTIIISGANVMWAFFDAYPAISFIADGLLDIGLLALFTLIFIFPTGRFVPRWSFIFLLPLLFETFQRSTASYYPDDYSGATSFISPTVLSLFAGIVFQFYRYIRVSTAAERKQTRWVILGFLGILTGLVAWGVFIEYLPYQPGMPRVWIHSLVMPAIILVFTLPLPTTIAIAMIQDNLWDTDLIINRTAVKVVLTTVIIGIYILILSLLSLIFNVNDSLISSIFATSIVALGFQPVRRFIQTAVNRALFGQRDEPQTILVNLNHQLRSAMLPQDLLNVSTESIGKSLRVPYVSIAIQHGENIIAQVEYGKNEMPTELFALIHQNERVGNLVVGQRSPNEKLNASDQAILSSIAQHMGTVVYAVRLQSDLQTAREKLVIAREEERRRIRRDLHDGLGPGLASQPLQFDTVIEHIPKNPEFAIEILKEMKQNAKGFVHDIRHVIQDLRPPTLDELGLVESLKMALSQGDSHRSDLQIRFHIPTDLQGLSAAVEVAAYRIIMEAVTNVRKHAQATDCHVKFRYTENRSLHVSIEDNGMGFPEKLMPGVGLQSMRERCEELGGRFAIEAIEPHGTRINATLPLISKREHMK